MTMDASPSDQAAAGGGDPVQAATTPDPKASGPGEAPSEAEALAMPELILVLGLLAVVGVGFVRLYRPLVAKMLRLMAAMFHHWWL
jgi:hypothetical protein